MVTNVFRYAQSEFCSDEFQQHPRENISAYYLNKRYQYHYSITLGVVRNIFYEQTHHHL